MRLFRAAFSDYIGCFLFLKEFKLLNGDGMVSRVFAIKDFQISKLFVRDFQDTHFAVFRKKTLDPANMNVSVF